MAEERPGSWEEDRERSYPRLAVEEHPINKACRSFPSGPHTPVGTKCTEDLTRVTNSLAAKSSPALPAGAGTLGRAQLRVRWPESGLVVTSWKAPMLFLLQLRWQPWGLLLLP